MKSIRKIDIIVPIILSVLLPFVSFYSNYINKEVIPFSATYFKEIGRLSLSLYIIWNVLFFVSKIKNPYLKWIVIGLFFMLKLVVLYHSDNVACFTFLPVLQIGCLFMLFLTIQFAIRANSNISTLEFEKEKLQTENYKAQLQTLRNKVDPHFLFNSLNTLRSLVRNNKNEAENFVLNLSDFYRQTMKFNEPSLLKISDEISVLKSYLYLMQQRNGKALFYEIKDEDTIKSYSIPTLALQIIVENCIKHNTMAINKPLQISIFSNEEKTITVKNNLQPKMTSKEPSGYGLENIKKRYELLGITNGVIIEKTNAFFSVTLKLI